jgi:hypothetical protein
VLLLEAGPDYPAVSDLPADIAAAAMPTTSHDWGFMAEPGRARAFGPAAPGPPDGRLLSHQRPLAELWGHVWRGDSAIHISERTVESHVRSILAKTGLTSRTELIRWYLQQPPR